MVVVMSRQRLANRLRQNWLSRYPAEPSIGGPAGVGTGGPAAQMPIDDSLTSLNWLHNLNVFKLTPPCPDSTTTVSGEDQPPVGLGVGGGWGAGGDPGPLADADLLADPDTLGIDFATNPHVKPPYSYSTLICMAMRASTDSKITLSGIYNWITDNFMYYQVAEPSWQNSIRHNLSLNKCFQKVPRRKDEPGKGGFWMINPNYENMLVNGILRKRRSPLSSATSREPTPVSGGPSSAKRSRLDADTPDNVLHIVSAGGADGGSSSLDVSWSAILHQDIDVGGAKVKTEDIIDERDDKLTPGHHHHHHNHPLSGSSISRQLSDSLSDDYDISELINANLDSPVDLLTGDPLDLTILGSSIRAPDWWSEQAHTGSFLDTSGIFSSGSRHPWQEDRHDFDNIDADIHRLFDGGAL